MSNDVEAMQIQQLCKEISTAAPRVTAMTKDGKLYLGLRVFIINGETEQQKIADIVDHLKYVATGLKWVIGEASNLNKLKFITNPLRETKEKETTLIFERAPCSCCHSHPHNFSLKTPIEARQEDIELDLMMSAFKHMLNE